MLIVQIITLATLFAIFIQDMKCRAVYWFLFPVLLLCFLFVFVLQHKAFALIARMALVNIGFLVLQFAMVTIYFSLKTGRLLNITTGLIGYGDLLFLLCIACYFPFGYFLLYYIFSLILVVAGWAVVKAIAVPKYQQIPLAGLQAVILMPCLIAGWFFKIPGTVACNLLNQIYK